MIPFGYSADLSRASSLSKAPGASSSCEFPWLAPWEFDSDTAAWQETKNTRALTVPLPEEPPHARWHSLALSPHCQQHTRTRCGTCVFLARGALVTEVHSAITSASHARRSASMTFWKEGGAGASAATTCDRARGRVFVPAQRRLQAAGVPSKRDG